VFHIFHRPPQDFASRLEPNAEFRARRAAHRRRIRNRRAAAVVLVVGLAAAATFGFRSFSGGGDRSQAVLPLPVEVTPPAGQGSADASASRPMPDFVRGVHVTMPLIAEGALDDFLTLTANGLNALVVEIKDEHGQVAFASDQVPLARTIQSAQLYYDPVAVVEKARASDVYLIGRIVVFQDPWLAERKPSLAVQRADGTPWRSRTGFSWANPYDERVWRYNVDLAVAAAKAGFDEIMFDYVRFPSDGDVSAAVYQRKTAETKAAVVARFLKYARSRIDRLGLGVKVSAAVFGLSATRNLGIGQNPRLMAQYLDVIHPMVYPSLYGPGEFNLPDPGRTPGKVVNYSLGDFTSSLRGRATKLVPWLQDFSLNGERKYTLQDIRAQVEAAERWRASGYLLWNPFARYTKGAAGVGGR
jgi:hypothetical protein